ncbi:bifunctional UDP-N-acetylglucosamine diphosphorylase/glucosamine-1-phosphate N-acetyltransferase GlmU [Endomicrobium proavitum]|uniref:Bifunctional protein GlmU n=1 Tax=Endomicrobium proavitum TaxID=1408281 RepID=A0A0G3WL33_9BACT|nr:bifunctional UDP-N-acetylglucosamine diphosphorylase/glucosamine-1-phosphate N-acetyltransferase GlmU [Endomicrobium proavitum]AKL98590.1 bifunctional glucosamine-1-phosphate N-acetyltransferase/UDP-N-acetylglucosamine pyrophosphorylase [Endomicrobium proavitum]
MKKFSAVILAAGAGTRMKSALPKVMHKLAGKPLIERVINSVLKLNPENIVVVLGHKSEIVEKYLNSLNNKKIKIVYQNKQLGSAHALMQAQPAFKNYGGNILVLSGDVPLVQSATLAALIKSLDKNKASVSVLAATVNNPFGYGRIIKNETLLEKIVEEKDASASEKLVKEINSGIYVFDKNIWNALLKVKPNNAKKEYYLTDTVEILKKSGKKAATYATQNAFEVQGVNDRKDLANAEKIALKEKIAQLLSGGVTIINPENVYVSSDAKIGRDTVLYPGAFIAENCVIGESCVIEGASFIKNSKIGDGSEIIYSYINGAQISKNVKIGPFAHIRPGTVLKDNVKVGNFSETKKAVIAKNSKVNHLSYIGDAEIGESVNIGAGTITCNYDGKNKHQTVIGSGTFVGSNVNFVAPVNIGKGALIAAGSTITKDIPAGKLAIARARQEHKRKIIKN